MFVEDKEYTLAKFNYWIAKQRAIQVSEGMDGFQEIGFSETKLGKVLEIEAPSCKNNRLCMSMFGFDHAIKGIVR